MTESNATTDDWAGHSTESVSGDQLATTANPVRLKLLEAGVVYPANWDDMGSSEKDLWEDAALQTLEARGSKP